MSEKMRRLEMNKLRLLVCAAVLLAVLGCEEKDRAPADAGTRVAKPVRLASTAAVRRVVGGEVPFSGAANPDRPLTRQG